MLLCRKSGKLARGGVLQLFVDTHLTSVDLFSRAHLSHYGRQDIPFVSNPLSFIFSCVCHKYCPRTMSRSDGGQSGGDCALAA